jgi:hypothetical protein
LQILIQFIRNFMVAVDSSTIPESLIVLNHHISPSYSQKTRNSTYARANYEQDEGNYRA